MVSPEEGRLALDVTSDFRQPDFRQQILAMTQVEQTQISHDMTTQRVVFAKKVSFSPFSEIFFVQKQHCACF